MADVKVLVTDNTEGIIPEADSRQLRSSLGEPGSDAMGDSKCLCDGGLGGVPGSDTVRRCPKRGIVLVDAEGGIVMTGRIRGVMGLKHRRSCD